MRSVERGGLGGGPPVAPVGGPRNQGDRATHGDLPERGASAVSVPGARRGTPALRCRSRSTLLRQTPQATVTRCRQAQVCGRVPQRYQGDWPEGVRNLGSRGETHCSTIVRARTPLVDMLRLSALVKWLTASL